MSRTKSFLVGAWIVLGSVCLAAPSPSALVAGLCLAAFLILVTLTGGFVAE